MKQYLLTAVIYGENPVTVRRGECMVDDFLTVMKTDLFRENIKKSIVVRFQSMEPDFNGDPQLELGLGSGPLQDLMSTLLDKFVLPRLSVLFCDGTFDASLFDFTEEEMVSELVAAGEISGRYVLAIILQSPKEKLIFM